MRRVKTAPHPAFYDRLPWPGAVLRSRAIPTARPKQGHATSLSRSLRPASPASSRHSPPPQATLLAPLSTPPPPPSSVQADAIAWQHGQSVVVRTVQSPLRGSGAGPSAGSQRAPPRAPIHPPPQFRYSTPRASSPASEACMTQAAAFDRAHALLRSAPRRTGNPWTLCATQYVLEPCVSDAVFYELLVCMGVRE